MRRDPSNGSSGTVYYTRALAPYVPMSASLHVAVP